jgi:hypothetical protein
MTAAGRLVRARESQEAKDVTLGEQRASAEVTQGKRPRTVLPEEWSGCLGKGLLTRSHSHPWAAAEATDGADPVQPGCEVCQDWVWLGIVQLQSRLTWARVGGHSVCPLCLMSGPPSLPADATSIHLMVSVGKRNKEGHSMLRNEKPPRNSHRN